MKAVVYERYGPPDVLELREVENPTPKHDEVLVKVHAATVSPVDWHLRAGTPLMARMMGGSPETKIPHIGG